MVAHSSAVFRHDTLFEIDMEKDATVAIEIFNTLGETVEARQIQAAGEGRLPVQLDLTGIPAGAYIVRYRVGSVVGVLPLQLEH
jgi:hypothetical protein